MLMIVDEKIRLIEILIKMLVRNATVTVCHRLSLPTGDRSTENRSTKTKPQNDRKTPKVTISIENSLISRFQHLEFIQLSFSAVKFP